VEKICPYYGKIPQYGIGIGDIILVALEFCENIASRNQVF
jgi:hypothetical protein